MQYLHFSLDKVQNLHYNKDIERQEVIIMKHLTVKEQELRAKALAFNPNIALWFGIKDTTIVRDG